MNVDMICVVNSFLKNAV